MISVEEAKKLIVETTTVLAPVECEVLKSLNHALAADVCSLINFPPFSQSAMDGYAIQYSDFIEHKKIEVVGEVPAGQPFNKKIYSGQSVKIFTGAKIPDGADTVVMQEKIILENNQLIIHDSLLLKNANVREKRSIIKEGDVVLKKGMLLNAGAIGFITGLGISTVSIFPKPKVSVIITGNELQQPGQPLRDGAVYESNSYSLRAALESIDIGTIGLEFVEDNEKQTTDVLKKALEKSDLVLITGGISVGKYDFVENCLHHLGVDTVFYKVAQKPGKPLFFGKKNNCLVFGLPGNTGSVLTCYYEYVFPVIKYMQGWSGTFPKELRLPVLSEIKKKEGLAFFLKATLKENKVEVLSGQESNNMTSFVNADCFIYLPANKENVHPGEMVTVHLLP